MEYSGTPKPDLSFAEKCDALLGKHRYRSARAHREDPFAHMEAQMLLPDEERDTPNERRFLSIEELHGTWSFFRQHGYFADETPYGRPIPWTT